MIKISAILSILFCCSFAGWAENGNYLFSYFLDNGQDGLHLAYSQDGLHWQTINQGKAFFAPKVGDDKLVRDPCILLGPDNVFHAVWTVSWKEKGFGVAHSADLIHWSDQTGVPVMTDEPQARNVWAPELFYDDLEKQYLIFWATTIPGRFPKTEASSEEKYNHRIYYTTTKDFKSYSKTQLYLDPGFSVIDSTLIKASPAHYVMFLKDETLKPPQKNIKIAIAEKPSGPFGPASEPITSKYWAEGPTALKIGDYWHVYFDKYSEGHYGVIRSKDLKTWEDISDQLTYPKGMRHGTAFAVSSDIAKKLLGL